ncbi:MAG: sigma-70 family RNA polymerase sigma factor [Lentisphaeraceae bacterium]|nr:sigma-70 family RNA polymerase sigma factor [Lentisphaeraceae bacterium]
MASDSQLVKNEDSLVRADPDLFISLFEADRNRLYSYIYAYVMDHTAADDIFQETSMTLWREFEKFEEGTNFSKWANGIAFNRVRVYRRKNKKFSLGLSEELMLSISETISKEDYSENRWHALQECRTHLRKEDQQLYEAFYVKNLKAQEVADESGRSIFAIRKGVHKLRKKLFDCVDRKKREGLI